MNKAEKNLIESLKFHARDHHPTLKPHSFFKDKYAVSLFYVDNHADLILSVRAILHLAVKAINPEMENSCSRYEKEYIRQALTIANRLLPQGEEAFLDQINTYLREEGYRKGLDEG